MTDAESCPTPPVDAFLTGMVFMDMIFSGLPSSPTPGTELWTEGLGSAPGGMANMAVAMSRLGLHVSLAAPFGGDWFGDFLWETLADQEEIDLSRSRQFDDWPTPVTVSLSHGGDRSMITYERPMPEPLETLALNPPQSRSCFVEVGTSAPGWLRQMKRDGALVFGDTAWDPTGTWSPAVLDSLVDVDVFLPNATEAMAYTRTTSPEAAVERLMDFVQTAVVKTGADGVLAADRSTGTILFEPAIQVDAVDATGAGDVFAGAFVFATLTGWSLADRLRFANLCAGLSVRNVSGSFGSPCWHEIGEWSMTQGPEVLDRYEFLA
ncbi:carbohydrate kinase family protein, partial [Microlunatus panaciterrae]